MFIDGCVVVLIVIICICLPIPMYIFSFINMMNEMIIMMIRHDGFDCSCDCVEIVCLFIFFYQTGGDDKKIYSISL